MEDVLQVPVSRGYLAKLCTGTISASLADAYDELTEAIPRQEQLGSDETSIKDNGKKHWIWCITAATFSVFHIAATRSREVLEKLVGPEFAGYLNFDYFSANCSFAWNYWIKAQYCWAHLIRDIRFLAEKHPDKKTKAWAEQLLDRSRRLFSAWHRRDEMTAEGFHRSMLTHRDRFLELVRNPPSTKEAANLAARFAIVEYHDGGIFGRRADVRSVAGLFSLHVCRRRRADEQSQRTTDSPLRDRPPHHARHARRSRPTLPRTHVDSDRHLQRSRTATSSSFSSPQSRPISTTNPHPAYSTARP